MNLLLNLKYWLVSASVHLAPILSPISHNALFLAQFPIKCSYHLANAIFIMNICIYWWPISTLYLFIKAALLALYWPAKLFSAILFTMCTLYNVHGFSKEYPKTICWAICGQFRIGVSGNNAKQLNLKLWSRERGGLQLVQPTSQVVHLELGKCYDHIYLLTIFYDNN